MAKIYRFDEKRAIATAKRRRLRRSMRELIDSHVQDPQVREEMQSVFNKVCEAYCTQV